MLKNRDNNYDGYSVTSQARKRKAEVFDEKEMEKTNLQEKAKSQVFLKIKYRVNLPLSGFP